MASLFIDTSITLTVGILDTDFNWISFFKSDERKSSAKIHKIIFELLNENNLKITELDCVFGIAGPGSYTGMRVTEGINQIFEMCGLTVYSFYHYQVPMLSGVKSGSWIANAYKGETFVYSWEDKECKSEVLPNSEFEKNLEAVKYNSPFFSAIPEDFSKMPQGLEDSNQLIYSNSRRIFSSAKNSRLRSKVYYYRSLSQEFKASK